MIGQLSSSDTTVKFGTADIGVQNLLASLSHDSDPRVRTSALQALVSPKLKLIIYSEF